MASSVSSVDVLCSAGILCGVPQLQQLHRPLDVGESAAAQLGVRVRVGAAGQPLGVDPGLDPADLLHRLGRYPAGRVAGLVDHQQEPVPEVLVAGHPVGPQQRLDLPRLRPLLVVRLVRRQGAHQRAVAALGPQVGVDLQRRVGARRAQQRAHLFGDASPTSFTATDSSTPSPVRTRT